MNEIEKAKYSERKLHKLLKELRAEGVRVHNSSDFSEDGYLMMLNIFIPFKKGYLTNKKISEFVLVLEGNYNELGNYE